MWVDFELISWQTLSDYLPQSPWAVQPSHSCRSSSVLTTDWALFCTPHQEIPVISTSAIAIYYLFISSPKCNIQYSQKVSQLLLRKSSLQHSASGTICNINIHHCHLLSVRTAYDTDCVFGQRAFFWDQVFSHTSLTEYAISRPSSPQHHILHNNFLSNISLTILHAINTIMCIMSKCHMQIMQVSLLQTDNHTSTPPLCFLQAGCPSCRPTNSVKALKAKP